MSASGPDPCGIPSLGAVLPGPGLCSQVGFAASAPSSPRSVVSLGSAGSLPPLRRAWHRGRLPLASAGAEIRRCARERGLCLPPGHPVAPHVQQWGAQPARDAPAPRADGRSSLGRRLSSVV